MTHIRPCVNVSSPNFGPVPLASSPTGNFLVPQVWIQKVRGVADYRRGKLCRTPSLLLFCPHVSPTAYPHPVRCPHIVRRPFPFCSHISPLLFSDLITGFAIPSIVFTMLILGAYAWTAWNPVSRPHLNRVSFRLLVYALVAKYFYCILPLAYR
jgi:hypothetical protein